mgnify:CR=1 FL=1
MSTPEPLDVLRQKRTELGTKQVAEDLGYSESTIRVVATGNYPGDPSAIYAAVLRIYVHVVHCPHVEKAIPVDDCRNRSSAPRPVGGRGRLEWWTACQGCPHKHLSQETQK